MSQLCFNWPIFLKLVTGFMWEPFMQIWKRRVPRQPLRGWEGAQRTHEGQSGNFILLYNLQRMTSASDIPLVSPRMWYLLVLHVDLPTKPKAWSVQVEICLTHCNLLSCYSDFSPSFFFEFNVGQSPAILWSLGISSNLVWGHIVLRTTISSLCPLYPSTPAPLPWDMLLSAAGLCVSAPRHEAWQWVTGERLCLVFILWLCLSNVHKLVGTEQSVGDHGLVDRGTGGQTGPFTAHGD